MKNSIKLVLALGSVIAFNAAANVQNNTPLITKWVESNESTIIKHKKGWASVMTLQGDRGTGLTITQGNKKATGLVMKSGNAKVSMSPSYVASGVNNNELGFSKETAAVVFKVEGAKLGGASGTHVALDVKSKRILWIDDEGNIVGEVRAD